MDIFCNCAVYLIWIAFYAIIFLVLFSQLDYFKVGKAKHVTVMWTNVKQIHVSMEACVWILLEVLFAVAHLVRIQSAEIEFGPITTYRRVQNVTHPISKAIQWLAWKADVWAGQGWSFILLCWGRFLYTPWDKVCQFSRKNLRRYFWEKVANFV